MVHRTYCEKQTNKGAMYFFKKFYLEYSHKGIGDNFFYESSLLCFAQKKKKNITHYYVFDDLHAVHAHLYADIINININNTISLTNTYHIIHEALSYE